ncbi:MAG: glycosyltransferase family 4 protein [Acidimicrobiales bacterium]|nr:glycosyltransferase family 4 protein [Acidimicrobiales bacterium]
MPNIDPTGLINHSNRRLTRSTPGYWQAKDTASQLDRVSRLIVSCEDDEPATPLDKLKQRTERPRSVMSLTASTTSGIPIPIHDVSGELFSDYLWQRLFEKGLAPAEFQRVRHAKYVSIRPSWLSMHSMGSLRRYPKLDTSDFDIFIAHTPWPSQVSPNTELIVRYHDAIPIFHPHQIKLPAMHQFHHSSALRSNAQEASFVCTSEATRRDLVTLYPHLEERSLVIPTSVSADFYPEPASDDTVLQVITANRLGGKPPRQQRKDNDDDFRYLLIVSTIEPRKNHLRLIDAWDRIRRDIDDDLNLVIVGSPGWGQGPIMQRIKKGQASGGLYHLAGVPTSDLRLLYSNAAATVCPSVIEGFDMSGIEAMFCGSPVVASDISVHTENYGDAAVYFEPYDPQNLVEVLENLLYSDYTNSQRNELVHRGLTHCKIYRRAELADRWGAVFENIRAGKFGAKAQARTLE